MSFKVFVSMAVLAVATFVAVASAGHSESPSWLPGGDHYADKDDFFDEEAEAEHDETGPQHVRRDYHAVQDDFFDEQAEAVHDQSGPHRPC